MPAHPAAETSPMPETLLAHEPERADAASAPVARPSFELEIPAPWFANPLDGDRHRLFWANLCRALGMLDARVTMRDIPFGGDAAPRLADGDTIVLAYHSHGAAKRVWRVKEHYVPPFYMIDRTGFSGWAEITLHPERFAKGVAAVDLAAARTRLATLRHDMVQHNLSKYPQSTASEPLPAAYVFFPLQTSDDPVARFASMDQIDVLCQLARLAAAAKRHLVVKRHPFCADERLAQCLREICDGGYVHLATGSVHRLIAGADAVLVANSGVGFEALLHGRPVFSYGRAEYEGATCRLRSPGELAAVFAGQPAVDADARDRLLYYLLEVHGCDARDPLSILRRLQRILAEEGRPALPAVTEAPERTIIQAFAEVEGQRRRNRQAASELLRTQEQLQRQRDIIDRQKQLLDEERLALEQARLSAPRTSSAAHVLSQLAAAYSGPLSLKEDLVADAMIGLAGCLMDGFAEDALCPEAHAFFLIVHEQVAELVAGFIELANLQHDSLPQDGPSILAYLGVMIAGGRCHSPEAFAELCDRLGAAEPTILAPFQDLLTVRRKVTAAV